MSATVDFPHWCNNNGNLRDDNFDAWLKGKKLSIRDTVRISPRPGVIQMHVSWDKAMLDVDASAAALDARGEFVDAVNFREYQTTCGSLMHSGDNRTGKNNGACETISVELAKIPLNVHHILFAVAVYKDGINFIQVPNLTARFWAGDDPRKGDELFTLPLASRFDRAMLVGKLTRDGAYWNFTALSVPVVGKRIKDILKNETATECIAAYPSTPPSLRRVQATVLKGRKLMSKHRGVRLWRRRTSDPYFAIRFNDRKFKSDHQRKTLEPEWQSHVFDLGRITETETRELKVAVFDYNKHSSEHDFMGVIRVPGSRLYNLGPEEHTFWFQLEQSEEEQYKAKEVSGEILLKFVIKNED